MATAEGVLERVVQHGGAHVEEGLHRGPAPAHLLGLVHTPRDDLVHGAFHERGCDRLTLPASGGIGHERRRVALKVAQQPGGALEGFRTLGGVGESIMRWVSRMPTRSSAGSA